jgi:hypothetical protein
VCPRVILERQPCSTLCPTPICWRAEKPARRFDTRPNGEKRTLALVEARGLILEEAADLADVVLGDGDGGNREPSVVQPAEPEEAALVEAREGTPPDTESQEPTIVVGSGIAPVVHAFVAELLQQERPAYLTTLIRRLAGDCAAVAVLSIASAI